MKCRICENEQGNQPYLFREMMHGLDQKFEYFQCGKCGCLQIKNFPDNPGDYYSSEYYSYSINPENFYKNPLIKLIRKQRDRYLLTNKGILGFLINLVFPNETLKTLSYIPFNKNSRILDVGCGNGIILYALKELGFVNCRGIDPFIKQDIHYNNGLVIEKKDLALIEGEWDVIMFHHSFEHMKNPDLIMGLVRDKLSPDGVCLIRIPTVSSSAWKKYRENWVQIDAPRHYFLHSVESMTLLGKKAQMNLKKVLYDSTDFQFWGSEQNLKNIPLFSDRSYALHPDKSIFSKSEILGFLKASIRLNSENQGDQAVFYFEKQK